jgi:hypothetical protein
MDSSQPPVQSIFDLLWDTLRLSVRLLWKSSVRPVQTMSMRQQSLAVLGLPLNATPQQIKQRYRTLAKKYHPDLGGDPRQMQRLVAAYEFLMKETAR